MDKVIVFLDDADHARRQLLAPPRPQAAAIHWFLVACPPRMTRHLSKWVNHRARANWRAKWAQRLYDGIVPQLQARGDQVSTLLADGPLPELTQALLAREGAAQVHDLRRPRPHPEDRAAGPAQPADRPRPSAITGTS